MRKNKLLFCLNNLPYYFILTKIQFSSYKPSFFLNFKYLVNEYHFLFQKLDK